MANRDNFGRRRESRQAEWMSWPSVLANERLLWLSRTYSRVSAANYDGEIARNSSGQHNVPRYYCRVAAGIFCDTPQNFFLRRRFPPPAIPPSRPSFHAARPTEVDRITPAIETNRDGKTRPAKVKGAPASWQTPPSAIPAAAPFSPAALTITTGCAPSL